MTQWLADQGWDEILVPDVRNRLRPTQMVDCRLRMMLGERPLLDRHVAESFQGRRPLAAEGRSGDT